MVPWMEGPGGKDARSEVMGEAEASGAVGVQGWEAAAYIMGSHLKLLSLLLLLLLLLLLQDRDDGWR